MTQTRFSHTKVMLNARRFVVMIYTRKHQVRKVKWRDAGNVGFRTQSHSSKEGGQGWLTKYVWGMRERERNIDTERERERGRERGRSKERRGERGDRSRGDLALISVRTTGWLWVEKEMMEATKFFILCHPVRSTCTLTHTHTHTYAHAPAPSRLSIWGFPEIWDCVLNMCSGEGACVFVCCKFSLCWILQVCGLFFSHTATAAAAAAGVFWGALCWNADGLFRGWFSGMHRKCFYAVNLSRVNRKKENNYITHFQIPTHALQKHAHANTNEGEGDMQNTDQNQVSVR